jgi:N6-adenosine-specific RNA methylase IME4
MLVEPIFAPLPAVAGGFARVHADPPWRFKSNSLARPDRNAVRHYRCLSLSEIAALPIRDVLARDALVFLWVPGPFLAIGAHVPILQAWGSSRQRWASSGSSSERMATSSPAPA